MGALRPAKGQYFYIRKPVGLLCECTGVDGNVISFHVENGYWNGKLNLDTGMITHRFGGYRCIAPIAWVGRRSDLKGEYNEAIYGLEEKLSPSKPKPTKKTK